MKGIVHTVVVLSIAGMAQADILEWRDEDGVRHFTNLKAEVPDGSRDSARVVVDEAARRPEGPAATAPAPEPAPEPRRQAEVVYDWSRVTDAYLQGLRHGVEAGRATVSAQGGDVTIAGPLATAAAAPPCYGYPARDYYPLVTTSFDRGRSRHLTLRLLLQDQFALDRAAPFVFAERLVPPFGYRPVSVDLNPFLPRGLPHGFPRKARVVTR